MCTGTSPKLLISYYHHRSCLWQGLWKAYFLVNLFLGKDTQVHGSLQYSNMCFSLSWKSMAKTITYLMGISLSVCVSVWPEHHLHLQYIRHYFSTSRVGLNTVFLKDTEIMCVCPDEGDGGAASRQRAAKGGGGIATSTGTSGGGEEREQEDVLQGWGGGQGSPLYGWVSIGNWRTEHNIRAA